MCVLLLVLLLLVLSNVCFELLVCVGAFVWVAFLCFIMFVACCLFVVVGVAFVCKCVVLLCVLSVSACLFACFL